MINKIEEMKKAIDCLAGCLPAEVHADMAKKFEGLEKKINAFGTEAIASEASRISLETERARLYTDRNLCVALLLRMCASNRWRIGTGPSPRPSEGFSRVAIVETPEGQLSWHYPDADQPLFDTIDKVFGEFPEPFDGHHHDEKFSRIRRIVAKIDEINVQMLGEMSAKVAAKTEGN